MTHIRLIWLSAVACLAFLHPAVAHPHVWITMRTGILFDGAGLISGLNMDWTFDATYTKMAVEGMDSNGDGVLDDNELAPVTKNNLLVLKDYDYFTKVIFGGKAVALGDVANYGQVFGNNKLAMHFHLPFKSPVDPRQGPVKLQIYDPDFFVDLEYDKVSPFKLVGKPPSGCKAELAAAATGATIDKTRQMLAGKGTDWKPENGEDFGSMFAQSLDVKCGS